MATRPETKIRWAIKYLLSLFFFYTGIVIFYRWLKKITGRSSIKIIAYHSVNNGHNYLDLVMTPDKFKSQIRFLKTHYEIITMNDAVNFIKNNSAIKNDMVVITFDDGYRDNYTDVFPIVSKYRVPITIYLSTYPINSDRPTFVYTLILAIENTNQKTLDLSSYGLQRYNLDSDSSREHALRDIDQYSRHMNLQQRHELLATLLEKLGLESNDKIFNNQMLSWNQVLEMKKQGVCFGAHTVNHPILSEISTVEAEDEIYSSKRTIENILGESVNHFAYPYGGRKDLNSAVIEIVKKTGFSSAAVLYKNALSPNTLFSLGRVMISNQMTSSIFNKFSKGMFACEISGFFDLLFRRI